MVLAVDLSVQVDEHPVVTMEMATELRDSNPRVRMERIEHAGHGLPFEQPIRLREVVGSFLRALP